MTHPNENEAQEIHPDAYEILKAATGDTATFFTQSNNGRQTCMVYVQGAYAAVSNALDLRDSEKRRADEAEAELARVREAVQFLFVDDLLDEPQGHNYAWRDEIQFRIDALRSAFSKPTPPERE